MSGETFETLLAANVRGVRTLVQTRLRASGQADDVVQDILLRAFAHKDQLRLEAKFRQWLWSIALNQIRVYFRRDRHIMSWDEFPNFDVRDPTTSPLARLERKERCDWLHACMAELSEREQLTIRLLDIEGKSLRDAAAALHSSVSAIKSAHFRARKRLDNIVRARACSSGHTPRRLAA